MQRDGTTLVMKEVPALVCDTCDDVSYTEAIGRRLDEMHEAAKTAEIDMAVRSFEEKQRRKANRIPERCRRLSSGNHALPGRCSKTSWTAPTSAG